MATATQPATAMGGLPHGLGLLTTVASLPPKYRARYLHIKTKCERPLDLSVKPISPQIANDVPMASSFTEVYTEPSNNNNNNNSNINSNTNHVASTISGNEMIEIVAANPVPSPTIVAPVMNSDTPTVADETAAIVTLTKLAKVCHHHNKPITPPLTPNKKRKFNVEDANDDVSAIIGSPTTHVERFIEATYTNPTKMAKTKEQPTTKRESTPSKPIRTSENAPKTIKSQPTTSRASKNKATRKLKFDEETSSPVSGTIIRPLEDITDGTMQYSNGDIDPRYNIVEITEETKAELAAIKNVIGDYVCKLCQLKFDDAFGLARHRCACIVLLEYRCPECGKQFNCPANLASHRRWHKPKKGSANGGEASANGSNAVARKENRNTTNSAGASSTTTNKKLAIDSELEFACQECGKGFKRMSYLRKHQITHNKKSKTMTKLTTNAANLKTTTKTITSTATVPLSKASVANMVRAGSYQSYGGSSSNASSLHSYNDQEEGGSGGGGGGGVGSTTAPTSYYEYDADSMSDCSSTSSSAGYGRLQIVESGLTEEENIAAAALTNLRNCASVIQHTTLAH